MPPGSKRWRLATSLAVTAGIGALLGALASPSGGAYLDLQAVSDPLHRLAVLAVPTAPLGALIGILLWWLGQGLRPLRWIGMILVLCAMLVEAAVLVAVIRFDRAIEERGLAGELGLGPAPQGNAGPLLGPFAEVDQPGLVSPELEDGDVLTLDRRSLARRTPDGPFRWNRPRPARPLASLTLAGDTALLAGPGLLYDDDAVLTAVDLPSGALRWTFHCLGNMALPVVIRGDRLILATQRPATFAVYLFDWTAPRLLWSSPGRGRLDLPPRFAPGGVEIAAGGMLRLLDGSIGEAGQERSACAPQPLPGIACREGQVVGWDPGAPP